ncbi:hypothetical protein EJ03DRAFT_62139 [Teratosphaeria nubilosa]|uniref:Uncharacterized protein n=1 Tax=Teratosphaeria nubilosa TaxID=161662 RepID=A0A6G1LCZ2_9PEZI|nr:hypothetical protein EJ03DRAFT_62139 [Teratosphaeria nubilosa]
MFLVIPLLLTTTLTSALPVRPRDPGTTLLTSDLRALDRSIVTAKNTIAAYQGGATAYDSIRAANAELIRRNRIAYQDAMTLSPQTVEDSNQIIAIVANPILPHINDYVATIISKQPVISAAGFDHETADTLNAISSDHDTLSLAVGAKLSPVTLLSAAQPVLAIDGEWRRAVLAFGGVPLAPLVFPPAR